MIYFVEDDDNIRKLVCYALSREGYEVKGFAVPSEFWNDLQENIPELILLDIMLPDKDGMTILKELRASRVTKSLPIIMLTAKSGIEDRVTGLDAGANDYLTKPFSSKELLARSRAMTRNHSEQTIE